MENPIFVFQKRAVDAANNEVQNENYISFMQVISAYWSEETGIRKLAVFTPTYTFTFGEKLGERFLREWNMFLRYLLKLPQTAQASTAPRRARTVIADDIVDEIPQPGAPVWEG